MTEPIKNSTVFQVMEQWAPKGLAYEWDNIGLQVGSYDKEVQKVMITLDVLESVVDEAVEKNVDLIIAHHPLLFNPLKQIDINTPKGRTIHKLIQHDISVYASHTNLDIAVGGVNDLLCDLLGIVSKENLIEKETEKLNKIIVYVPASHLDEVRDALSDSGAGHIGNYSHCTFETKGKGTFKPLEGTDPYSGTKNELSLVDEVKLETIVKNSDLSKVIHAMIKSHPYEEVAYDVFPLLNEGESLGIGRVGLLPTPISLKELSEHVKGVFNVSHVRVTGELNKMVEKIAILGGSGEKFINEAKQMAADVYITGDMTFHTAQDAMEMGLSVIDPGHYVEKVMKKATKYYLDRNFQESSLKIIVSETNTDPFQYV